MEEGPPAPGLTPVRGSAPDPAGAAPLRPALKSKTFLKGENTLPKMLANLTPLPPPKSQIRKEALRRSFAPPSGSSFDYKMLPEVGGRNNCCYCGVLLPSPRTQHSPSF